MWSKQQKKNFLGRNVGRNRLYDALLHKSPNMAAEMEKLVELESDIHDRVEKARRSATKVRPGGVEEARKAFADMKAALNKEFPKVFSDKHIQNVMGGKDAVSYKGERFKLATGLDEGDYLTAIAVDKMGKGMATWNELKTAAKRVDEITLKNPDAQKGVKRAQIMSRMDEGAPILRTANDLARTQNTRNYQGYHIYEDGEICPICGEECPCPCQQREVEELDEAVYQWMLKEITRRSKAIKPEKWEQQKRILKQSLKQIKKEQPKEKWYLISYEYEVGGKPKKTMEVVDDTALKDYKKHFKNVKVEK